MSTVSKLAERGLAHPPKWLSTNICYETIMGSMAYGVSSDSSDLDVYGFCIPKKEEVFPHLRGEIPGFGRQKNRFEQYQEHGIQDRDALGGHGRTYDLTIFNIVKFFTLAMENNPNIMDSIFTPANCVLHSTRVGVMVRENRRLFLHKGYFHKTKGYAYSQLNKLGKASQDPDVQEIREFEEMRNIPHSTTLQDVCDDIDRMERGESLVLGLSEGDLREYRLLFEKGTSRSGRFEQRKIHNTDTKFMYHVVRLLDQAEQAMVTHDINLQHNNEQLKAIRRGEWKESEVRQWAADKERQLEDLYHRSDLRHSPDESRIRQLLMDCLEDHYGTLEGCVVNVDAASVAISQIKEIIDRFSQ